MPTPSWDTLLSEFVDSLSKKRALLIAASEETSTKSLLDQIHKLKGSAGAYGLDHLYEVTRTSEDQIRSAGTEKEVLQSVTNLIAALDAAVVAHHEAKAAGLLDTTGPD